MGEHLNRLVQIRADASSRFFESEAARIASLCHGMAERFARGGRIVAFGSSPAARSDVRHVAVEFVHPVIVGKRALPAIGLAVEGGPLALQAALVLEPGDIAIAFGLEDGMPDALAALAEAKKRGCLTVAFSPAEADWVFDPPSDDAFVRQEMVETLYHVLWELVHVFFEHRGLLSGRDARERHDAGRSSFLYPFLGEQETDLESVLKDVARSVVLKAEEVSKLRAQTIDENGESLSSAAAALRRTFDGGGKVLVLGNGGSATDAMDAVADLRLPPDGWTPRRSLDLTEDSSIITAIGNDIGPDAIFSRQIIAFGRAGDSVLAFSTSGGSRNVIAALAEARRRGLTTIAMVGYDGGRIASEGLADFVIVTRSENIPRIQEAQATAWHALRELIEADSSTGELS